MAAVTRALDTRVAGIPLVVFNPLSVEREDVVEADVDFAGGAPDAVRVMAPDGGEVPAQVTRREGRTARVVFLAAAPAVGFAVFDVRPAHEAGRPAARLSLAGRVLENERYRVEVGAGGDIVSVRDVRAGRELLSGPLQLQLLRDQPSRWPAWEVEYADLADSPRAVVGGTPRLQVAESGPARVALQVSRETGGSSFVQTIRLAAGGAGDRVEIATEIDWRSKGTLLKAAFPLAAASDAATYDLGLGTVERGVNTPRLYEVPGQRWADLTSPDGSYGVAILNDSKYGWDHPDPGTLRLTLVHTPAIVEKKWQWVGDQASLDLGHHRVVMAVAGHTGGWREGNVPWLADRLNQPLLAWQAAPHPGALGRSFALARLSAAAGAGTLPAVAIRALKLAEESEELVVRMEELHGRSANGVRLEMARPIAAFRELDAAEEPLAAADPRTALPARLAGGELVVTFAPYQPRTFALRLAPPPVRVASPRGEPVPLPYDLDGITARGATDGDLDGRGHSLAAELVPGAIVVAGLPFRMGPTGAGRANLVACRGQRVPLPAGGWDALYVLAAAVGGDREAAFGIGPASIRLWVQDWAEPVGQWDDRLQCGVRHDDPSGIVPAYTKPARLGWLGTHRHDERGRDQAYALTSFFLYRLDLPRGVDAVVLPDDPGVLVLAATVAADDAFAVGPASPLRDVSARTSVTIRAPRLTFLDSVEVGVTSPNPGATVRYTTDGSVPTAGSPVARGPVRLTRSVTLKARAFAAGLDDSFVAEATFTRVPLRAAASPSRTDPGLRCRYVEGRWRALPDLEELPPAKEAVVPEIAAPAFARQEYFAAVLTGFLRVPADGIYVPSLRSDDTAELDLGGAPLIDAADATGGGDDRRAVALAAGLHPISVRYLHRRLAPALQLWIEGPGFAMRPVRQGDLVHE